MPALHSDLRRAGKPSEGPAGYSRTELPGYSYDYCELQTRPTWRIREWNHKRASQVLNAYIVLGASALAQRYAGAQSDLVLRVGGNRSRWTAQAGVIIGSRTPQPTSRSQLTRHGENFRLTLLGRQHTAAIWEEPTLSCRVWMGTR